MEHKNEAPDRIWIDHNNPDNQYDCGEVYITPNMVEYVRKDAACVEVKPGYVVYAKAKEGGKIREIPLSEALTIRTVDDVRAEVFAEIKAYETQFDTPAPSREDCPECKGSGMRDSGGVYPWGEHIEVPCDCNEPQPAPTPEPVAYMGVWPDGGIAWVYQNFPKYPHSDLKIVALYPTPPETPASHAEELRKAKEDAWNAGWSAGANNRYQNENPYAAPEGGE